MRVFLSTFGCKTNQYDTALLGQALAGYGFEVAGEPGAADWVVVNTCAVTGRSEEKARQWVRKIGREHPGVSIAVVGCSVEVSAGRFSGLPGVRLLLGTEEKFRLGKLLADLESGALELSHRDIIRLSGEVRKTEKYPGQPVLKAYPGRSRAFVKIQDGCSQRCAYCIVPFTRGPSRSRPAGQVLEEVRSLEAAGHLETVLSGIHIGRYGRDLPGGVSLAGLVASLLKGTEKVRFRLSSVEAAELEPELASLLEREERLCRHLHVPLQHGARSVLKRMGRHYSPGEYLEAVGPLVERIPGLGLGTDLIVGFPGETEDEFRECVNFVEGIPFTYLHVFPFSPRPGTPAAGMGEAPPRRVVRERVKVLREVSARKNASFLASLAGREVPVLPEKPFSAEISSCRADNYARVYHRGKPAEACIYRVRVERTWRDGVWAQRLPAQTGKSE
ncbi:MAG: tRNA (N(6)-L-threonylcarbamoyladenosine(37)-C(2))-methylthiotransferase MtaB [Candidatus Glassbacteria bacterium]|nr:tRNA (N(6)-L-threonylcarbamoyladenosine(37)-C(2))-methylthiotransferase MtaB [Candidatus Glassbacteria bacterium]